ncbi:MAG: hypothetical protein PHW87_04670 [Methanothrix sp.]|nr:hypothetical protein [Methanothrix sp.]
MSPNANREAGQLNTYVMLMVLFLLFGNSLAYAESLSELRKNADFAIWLSELGHLFEVEYKAGMDPMEIDQRARFNYQYDLEKSDDPTSNIILDLLNFTDNAITNVDLEAINKLAKINETLLKLDPTLGNKTWYQQLMTTADVIIQSNFEVINGTIVPRNKKTNPLYITHNSSVHSDLIAGPYPEGSVPCSL